MEELRRGGMEEVCEGDELICIVDAEGVHANASHATFPLRAFQMIVLPRRFRVECARHGMYGAAKRGAGFLSSLPSELLDVIATHIGAL